MMVWQGLSGELTTGALRKKIRDRARKDLEEVPGRGRIPVQPMQKPRTKQLEQIHRVLNSDSHALFFTCRYFYVDTTRH